MLKITATCVAKLIAHVARHFARPMKFFKKSYWLPQPGYEKNEAYWLFIQGHFNQGS